MSWSCENCGLRCRTCDERMCASFGPEPSTEDPGVCVECQRVPA